MKMYCIRVVNIFRLTNDDNHVNFIFLSTTLKMYVPTHAPIFSPIFSHILNSGRM